VLAAIPEGVTLPDDETLGRIAYNAVHENSSMCGVKKYLLETGAAIRAKLEKP
jgi:hypothetical protein